MQARVTVAYFLCPAIAIKLIAVIIVGYHCYQLHKNVSYIILSTLSPGIDKIIEDHQCAFRSSRSNTGQNFCIRQILKKKCKYVETLHQLFIDFKKAYRSMWKKVLYSVFIDFGVSMKLVKVTKMYLSRTYSKVLIVKHCLIVFFSENSLKQRDALSPPLLKFALE
jgi:hypothetical protein